MSKVLIDRPLHADARKLLTEHAEAVEIFDDDREKIESALKEVDGVICSAALKMREPEIAMAGNLKVIGRPGVGYDSVDVDACNSYGIPLVYTPDGPTESVAEHVILMTLMAAKRINEVQKAIKEHGDFGIRTRVTGMEVQGKTMGLVGFGRIGRRVAEIASRGLDMRILVYDPFLENGNIEESGYEIAESLESLLGEADVVSLHIPFSAKNERMFGSAQFRNMKKTSIFINTARGGVVDEEALISALRDGTIAAAGVDVFAQEPPEKENPLFTFENVVATPHLSSFTDDGKRKMGITVVEGVLDVLAGRNPRFLVNEEVWGRRRR